MLQCIKYGHQWQLCGDLKAVALVIGLQGGYTEYCRFLCEWKDWPATLSVNGALDEKWSTSTFHLLKQNLSTTTTHKTGTHE